MHQQKAPQGHAHPECHGGGPRMVCDSALRSKSVDDMTPKRRRRLSFTNRGPRHHDPSTSVIAIMAPTVPHHISGWVPGAQIKKRPHDSASSERPNHNDETQIVLVVYTLLYPCLKHSTHIFKTIFNIPWPDGQTWNHFS